MDRQCKCGSFDFFTQKQGSNTGLYCSMCGKWQKWLNKDEVRLFENNRVLKKKNTKPTTNADRIRQMTDEELAELFVHWSCDDADYATLLPIKGVIWGTREEMIKCNLEYLKQEVEEKDE